MTTPYLLALDLGTSSIGYAVFALEDSSPFGHLIDAGVRIFPNGRDQKTQEPLAVARRKARGMRRNRDRGQNRIRRLVRELIEYGLLPADKAERDAVFANIDPYAARAKAVDNPVDAYLLGRAIFHIGRRRGFKSNRLSGEGEESAFKEKIDDLRQKLGGRTLGQYLFTCSEANRQLRANGRPIEQKIVRFRNGEADFYPDRQMYQDEFARIREVQGNRHLTDIQWDALQETAFWQWPLKPVPKGKCRYYPEEPRASSALPAAQRFRIYQEVNNLRFISQGEEYGLDERQRLALYEALDKSQSGKAFKTIRQLKDEHKSPYFPTDAEFNLDVAGRGEKLLGNPTVFALRKQEHLGKLADSLDEDKLNDLVAFLIDPITTRNSHDVVMETSEVEARLRNMLPGLPDENIHALIRMRFKRDTVAVSRKFLDQINPVLKRGLIYSDAVETLAKELGVDWHHSLSQHDEHELLPYYGKILRDSVWGSEPDADKGKAPDERDDDAFHYGKIANPTVHVALNQLRRVVNEVIGKHSGKPAKIHVELTRDLKSSKEARARIQSQIKKNQAHKDEIAKRLKEDHGIEHPHREDFQKYMLWEELDTKSGRLSIFSGRPISAHQLFNGEVEVEHIIPFRRCYDDGMVNKTLAFRGENQRKGNRTPAEVPDFDQEAMLRRALAAFRSGPKFERFKPGAFEKFYGEGQHMLERQLNDTRYISRIAAQYLRCLFPQDKNPVVSVNGRMTAALRRVWDLNHLKVKDTPEYRQDHFHHVIDAFVVGLTSRHLINQLSHERGNIEQTEDNLHEFLKHRVPDIGPLRQQLWQFKDTVIASYKADHTQSGSMFNDTAYGIRQDGKQTFGLTRKAVNALSYDEVFQVCGKGHRQQLVRYLVGGQDVDSPKALKDLLDKKAFEKKLAAFSDATGIRKFRVRVPNNSIKRIESAPYKGYGKNSYAYCDVWMIPHKKDNETGEWISRYEGTFVAYAEVADYRGNPKRPVDKKGRAHPAAKRLMRIYKQDNVRLIDKLTGEATVMRVAGYSTGNNKLDMQPNRQAEAQGQNHKSINAIFTQFHVQKLHM